MIDYPRTKEQAAKYRYGCWAGFPQGNQWHKERCAMEVWEQSRGGLAYQCLRKPGHGPSGLYCKQHARKVEPRGERVN